MRADRLVDAVLDERRAGHLRGSLPIPLRGMLATGHLPGASTLELGAPTQGAVSRPDGLVATCGHGERASGACMLERAGRADVAVLPGGPGDWAAAPGRATEASA